MPISAAKLAAEKQKLHDLEIIKRLIIENEELKNKLEIKEKDYTNVKNTLTKEKNAIIQESENNLTKLQQQENNLRSIIQKQITEREKIKEEYEKLKVAVNILYKKDYKEVIILADREKKLEEQRSIIKLIRKVSPLSSNIKNEIIQQVERNRVLKNETTNNIKESEKHHVRIKM